jgi:hypothetical protein
MRFTRHTVKSLFLPRQQKAPSGGRDVAQQGRCSGNTAFAWSGSTIGKFLGEK